MGNVPTLRWIICCSIWYWYWWWWTWFPGQMMTWMMRKSGNYIINFYILIKDTCFHHHAYILVFSSVVSEWIGFWFHKLVSGECVRMLWTRNVGIIWGDGELVRVGKFDSFNIDVYMRILFALIGVVHKWPASMFWIFL